MAQSWSVSEFVRKVGARALSLTRVLPSKLRAIRRRARRHSIPPRFRRKVLFEMLEQRVLLSGDPIGSLASGILTANLTDGVDRVVVTQIGASTAGYTIDLRVGDTTTRFQDVTSIVADGKDGDDTFEFIALSGVAATVTGGAGTDTLSAADATNLWVLASSNGGSLGDITFTGTEVLQGGTGADTYRFNTGAAGSFIIDESAGGTDTLDFSLQTAAITVDLASATAQQVKSGLTLTLSSGDVVENLVGGAGNDKLSGNALANVLTGGAGNDTLLGDAGDDRYVFTVLWGTDIVGEEGEAADGNDQFDFSAITGALTVAVRADGTFTATSGSNSVTAENVERLLAGSGAASLDYSAFDEGVVVDLKAETATGFFRVTGFRNVTGSAYDDQLTGDNFANILVGGAGADTVRGRAGADNLDGGLGFDTLLEVEDSDQTLTDTSLAMNGVDDVIAGFETASLTGGAHGNTINVSGFSAAPLRTDTPLALLNGGSGVDLAANDLHVRLRSGALVRVDLADAKTVADVLAAIKTAHASLDAQILAGGIKLVDSSTQLGTTALSAFSISGLAAQLGLTAAAIGGTLQGGQLAVLTATLHGGAIVGGLDVTLLSALNGGSGVGTSDVEMLDLTGLENVTHLAALNGGDGVRTVTGTDLRIMLRDGQFVDVDVDAAGTLKDLFDAITGAANLVAPGKLGVRLDDAGSALWLTDASTGSGHLSVQALGTSLAALDLGILGTGSGGVLSGGIITDVSADLQVRLRDGTRVNIDLTGAANLQEVLALFAAADARLSAVINADGTGIDLHDTSGGSGTFAVLAKNGSHAAQDLGLLGLLGSGSVLSGASVVTGNVRLDGRLDHDSLTGSAGADILGGGGGTDTLAGGGGIDRLVESRNANFTLTNGSLTIGSDAADTLSGIERATLTGGASANTISAATFTGAVILVGGAGNDVLTGGGGDDFLTGGTGIDTLTGGDGFDTVVESGDSRFTLSGTTTTATLDMGEGASEVVMISLTGETTTGGTFTLTFDGQTTRAIAFDATSPTLKSALLELSNIGDEDISVSRPVAGGPWYVTFRGPAAGLSVEDLSASGTALVGGGSITVTVTTQGAAATNSLAGIEAAHLTGAAGSNTMDASGYGGRVTLVGGAGDDVLKGTASADVLLGGSGNDLVTGGGGNDLLAGGAGADTVVEERNTGFTLTDATLSIGSSEVDRLSGFEQARLTSGSFGDVLDASGFSGVNSDTELQWLHNGQGVRTTDGVAASLAGVEDDTPIAALNDGAGVRTVAGSDLRITLRDSTHIDVDISFDWSLQRVLNALNQAPTRLTASLDDSGTAIKLVDLTTGSSTFQVTALNSSLAAADLGILGAGTAGVLVGTSFSDESKDLRVTLASGAKVDVDLSGLQTLQEVLDLLSEAHPSLVASLTTTGAIRLTDSSTGTGVLTVTALNGSNAAADLGILGAAATGTPTVFTGTALSAAWVSLDGGDGNDTLVGSAGSDRLVGGLGEDSITGGGGIDLLVESRDVSFDLDDDKLVSNNGGTIETDTLSGIERAELTGGTLANTIDASGFTGSVTIVSGGGADTLTGGSGDDVFKIDISGLTGTQRVTLDTGAGANEIVILGAGSTIDNADFAWIDQVGNANADNRETIDTENITSINVDRPGRNVTLKAKNITVTGGRIYTGSLVGNAGDILIWATEKVSLQGSTVAGSSTIQHLEIDATSASGTDGRVQIWAKDERAKGGAFTGDAGFLGFANLDYIDVSIDIGAVTIRGGDVEVIATADSQRFFNKSDWGEDGGKEFGFNIADGLVGALEGLSFIAGVTKGDSIAKVAIGTSTSTTIIEAADFTAWSSARVRVAAAPIAIFASVAIGLAHTDAKAEIGNADITTTGDLTVRASTDQIIDVVGDSAGIAGVAPAFAFSRIDSDATAHVQTAATLDVGGDLFVQADTLDRNRTLARSSPGGDGMVAAAVAISIERGHTNAWLDGDADVDGSINVTAKQEKAPLERNKAVLAPSVVNGVTAHAGVGLNSTGDLLDDVNGAFWGGLFSPITGPIKNYLLTKWYEHKGKEIPKESSPSFQLSAGVAVVDDLNETIARIGDGNTADRAVVHAGGAVNVTSTIKNRPAVSASAQSVAAKEDANGNTDTTDSTGKVKVKRAGKGFALAVAVGVYDNQAKAFIEGDATLDAQGDITVRARALNEIDPLSLWGVNLFSPFFSQPTTYGTGAGTKTMYGGDQVQLAKDYSHGGDDESYYRYIGADGQSVILGNEDYSDTLKWRKLGLTEAGVGGSFMKAARNLTSYMNSNLGLDNNLADSWSQAAAIRQKDLSIAGAVTVLTLSHDAIATIKSGARVNQDESLRNDNQHVTVFAESVNQTINLGGNVPTATIGQSANTVSKSKWNFSSWMGTSDVAKKFDKKTQNTDNTLDVVGVTGLGFHYFDDVSATIEDGVLLYADSLKVEASNRVLGVTLGASGSQADRFAFNGVAVYTEVDNTTIAQIADGAVIQVGNDSVDSGADGGVSTRVKATDSTYLVSVAGTLATSARGGVGGSLVINDVNRRTEALIGSRKTEADLLEGGRFTSAGAVDVRAKDDGFIGGIAIAGAAAANEKKERPEAQGETAVAAAVGYSGNYVVETVLAYVKHATVIAAGDITLTASNETVLEAFAIGGSLARGKETGVALSGAGATNTVTLTTEAFIEDSGSGRSVQATAGSVALSATDSADIFAQSGAISITWPNNKPETTPATDARNVSIGASVTLNTITSNTRAAIGNSLVTASGDVTVTAKSEANTHSLAIGGSVSNSKGTTSAGAFAGAGAGADNDLRGSLSAIISASTVIAGGSVRLSATDSTQLTRADAFGIAASYASGQAGTTGALAFGVGVAGNVVSRPVKAYIVDSTVDAGGDVSATADASAHLDALGLGIAAAVATATGTAFGVAGAGSGAVNKIDNEIAAYIASSGDDAVAFDPSAAGVVDLAADTIRATAHGLTTGQVVVYSRDGGSDIGGLVTGQTYYVMRVDNDKFQLAASLANALAGTAVGLTTAGVGTTHRVQRAGVRASGAVSLKATDGAKITADAGGYALSLSESKGTGTSVAVASGVAVSVNKIGKGSGHSVKAYVDASSVTAGTGVTLEAGSTATIKAVTIGGAAAGSMTTGAGAGGALAGAGAGSYVDIRQTIEAAVRNGSTVRATGTGADVTLKATDGSSITADAGGVAIAGVRATGGGAAGALSLGAATATNTIDNSVTAKIDGSTVSAAGDVTLSAKSTATIDALAFGVAGSYASGTGAGLVGAFAGAGSGASNTIDVRIAAFIAGSGGTRSVEGATGEVTLTATDNSSITADAGGYALSYAGATGAGTTVAGAVGASSAYNDIGKGSGQWAKAYIDNSVVKGATKVALTAVSTAHIDALAMGGSLAIGRSTGSSLSGAVAGAGAGTINDLRMTVSAMISGGSTVQATGTGGDITLSATDTSHIKADAGGVAIGYTGSAGGAGSGALSIGAAQASNTINNDITAAISGSTASAQRNVSLTAASTTFIDALAFGTAAAVANGAGSVLTGAFSGAGAGAGNKIDTRVSAYIDGTPTGGVAAIAGSVTLSATDGATITADAGGFAVSAAISKGTGTTIGAAIGAGQSDNDIGKNGGHWAKAYINNATVTGAAGVSLTGTTTATITALAMGGALGVGGSSGTGLTGALAGAGAGTTNDIRLSVEAIIKGASTVTTTATGADVTLTATDDSTITADAGGVALSVAIAKGGGSSGAASIGAAVATNTIDNDITAAIDGSGVTAADSVSLTASTLADIDALAFGAAGAVSGTSGTGLTGAFAGAGAGTSNKLDARVSAYIKDASNSAGTRKVQATAGTVTLSATDDSTVIADAGGFAVGIAATTGSAANGSGTIGASQADNDIGKGAGSWAKAYIEASTVSGSTGVSLTAKSTADIEALAMGGAGSGAGGAGSGLSGTLAGAGAGTTNDIQVTIEAVIKGGSTVTVNGTNGDITLSATDDSDITADAGGVAIAISAATGGGASGSGSIGAAVATNTINTATTAAIDGSSATAARNVSLTATSTTDIDALAFGAAVAGSGSTGSGLTGAFAGAGAGTSNKIDARVSAYIKDASSSDGTRKVQATAGTVTLSATDDSTIIADAGGFAVGIAAATGGAANGSGTIGAAQADNDIGKGAGSWAKAYIEASTVSGSTGVSLTAKSTTDIEALAMGGAGSGAGGAGSGLSGALAGAGAGTTN
ncbi:MAG: Hemolysin-type calcium-binding region, partial [Ramlibacter sp.]|nr:Hemolysin-type calcium-binding region [Ramlibacter sp.]